MRLEVRDMLRKDIRSLGHVQVRMTLDARLIGDVGQLLTTHVLAVALDAAGDLVWLHARRVIVRVLRVARLTVAVTHTVMRIAQRRQSHQRCARLHVARLAILLEHCVRGRHGRRPIDPFISP